MIPATQLQISHGGSARSTPQSSTPSQVQHSSRTGMPSLMPAQVLASALLLATNGGPGVLSRGGKQTAETSDGLKPLASSYLLALSAQQVNQGNISGSSVTTGESLKVGGKAGAGIEKQTKFPGISTASQVLTNALLLHAMLPVERTQLTHPQEDFTHLLISSSQQSAFLSPPSNLSSISISDSPDCVPSFPNLDPVVTTNRVLHSLAPTIIHPSPTPALKPRHSRPSPYSLKLTPQLSLLWPHCLAQDRLRSWRPSPAVCSHTTTQGEDLAQVFEVMSNTWAESTHESYSSGILSYHVFCDKRKVPEDL